MSGYHRGSQLCQNPQARILVFRTGDPDSPYILKAYEQLSIEETDQLIKTVLRLTKSSVLLPVLLIAIQVAYKSPANYTVELIFEDAGETDLQELASKEELPEMRIGIEDYQLSHINPLYTNPDEVLYVEVVEGSARVMSLPVVIKRYHCGRRNVNVPLQEALTQMKVEGAFTVQLINVSIGKSARNLFQVDLIMEMLEGDLGADIQRRAKSDNFYTEPQLLHILECVAEALLFAKLRVSTT